MQEFGDAEIWVSSESFTDIFYVMSKAFPSHDIQRAFDRSLDFLHVCSVGESELREALRANWDDLEDAVIYTCCRNVDADFLLTRDAKGFAQSQTPALSPEEFFAWLEREHDLVYSGLQ
jgi:predicted nucleic acid-binding protein